MATCCGECDCCICGWGKWTGKPHDQFVKENTYCTPHEVAHDGVQ